MSYRWNRAALLVPIAAASLGCKVVALDAPASGATPTVSAPTAELADEARQPLIGPPPPPGFETSPIRPTSEDAAGGAVCVTDNGAPYIAPEC